MAVPFLATLTSAARLAYPAIVGGVRRGLSANRIQGILSATGIGIRRSTLLDIVARSRANAAGGVQVVAVRANGGLPIGFGVDGQRSQDGLDGGVEVLPQVLALLDVDLIVAKDRKSFLLEPRKQRLHQRVGQDLVLLQQLLAAGFELLRGREAVQRELLGALADLAQYDYVPTKDIYAKVRNAIAKALELDDTLSEAHAELASIKMQFEWDWDAA